MLQKGKTMNIYLRKVLILCLLLYGIRMAAQSTSKPERIFIAEGYFFNEIPVDFKQLDGMTSIETANGTKAIGLFIKEPISEEAKQKAIPSDLIPEWEILLEIFNENLYKSKRGPLSSEEKLKTGDKFPSFSATDLSGKIWTDTDVKGKVMVLNCWFTGCKPCRAEMPELSQWKEEMPDVMFFSSTYEKAETARLVLEKTGFNWIPIVYDRQFKEYVGAEGYPMTIIVDKDGFIMQIEHGTSPAQREKLKQTIQSLR